MANADENSPKTDTLAQKIIEQNKSDFKNKLDEFADAANKCTNEWLKAKEQCELDGDCATNELFQILNAQKEIYDSKINFIEKTMKFYDELEKFGVMHPFNTERTIKKITRR
jgi:hypothetical protein